MCGTISPFRQQAVKFVYCITLLDWGFRKRGRQVRETERQDLNPSEVRNVGYLFKIRTKKNNINENNMFFCLKY